jgi:hypothetical protein
MPLRYFGQFLIDEGEVDEAQLKDACDLMYWVNRSLGELAVKTGFLTHADVERVCRAQTTSDALFGELAIDLELLSHEQVAELLASQRSSQLRLGEALVELGHLDPVRLRQLVDRHVSEQAQFSPENRQLPEVLQDSDLPHLFLEAVPKVALRTALLHVRVGGHRVWHGGDPFEARARIRVAGPAPLELGIAATAEFPGAVGDTVAGFLARATRFAALRLPSPPSVGEPKRDVFPTSGIAFDFISIRGDGLLVLNPGTAR